MMRAMNTSYIFPRVILFNFFLILLIFVGFGFTGWGLSLGFWDWDFQLMALNSVVDGVCGLRCGAFWVFW